MAPWPLRYQPRKSTQRNKRQTRSKPIKTQTTTIETDQPPKEKDLITQVQIVLKAAIHDLKYTQAIKNIERIPDIKAISIQYDFPAIGIMDGGMNSQKTASVSLDTEIVILAIYVKVLGDQEACIHETRQIVLKSITELRKKEHYQTGGTFEGYTRAWNPRQSEIKQIYKAEDYTPLLMKLARIEYTKQEILTK